MMNKDKYPTVNPYIGEDGHEYRSYEELKKANEAFWRDRAQATSTIPELPVDFNQQFLDEDIRKRNEASIGHKK